MEEVCYGIDEPIGYRSNDPNLRENHYLLMRHQRWRQEYRRAVRWHQDGESNLRLCPQHCQKGQLLLHIYMQAQGCRC
jgi:hypothetical protein